MIAVNSDDDGERQKELLSLLRSQRVEGILLVIAAAPTPLNQISRILDAGIPVVCLDRIPDRVAVDSVSVDDLEAADMGIRHLVSMGLRRIAIVTGPLALKNERRRVQGYRRALQSAGIPVEGRLIWEGNLRAADVAAMCREKLADCGLRTPRDIAFATFDELTADDLFSPAVTTVVQPAYGIGFHAAGLLLDRIERVGGLDDTVTIRLSANLK